MTAQRRLVVVGNGMVGQHLVEVLRERDAGRAWQVTVLAEENRPAYDRVALSSYFDGVSAAELDVVASGCYDDEHYALHLDESVVRIDRIGRSVGTSRGRTIGYDALVLATGSYPFVPPVPGRDLPGCFVYRTIDDLDAIRAAAERAAEVTQGRRAGLVVGGGLLGLEAARALRLLGMSSHVVELAPRLMPIQVDEGGAGLLRTMIERLDVTVHLGTSVSKIERDGDRLLATLANKVELDLDVVVFSAGVRPRDQLGRDSGLAVGERGGIVVDSGCRTSDENIYAVGECARIEGRVYGLVGPGYSMADVVADRLLDGAASFAGADTSTKLKLMGVDVASFGDALATTEGALEITLNNPVDNSYAKLVVSDDAKTLLGGILVGDAAKYALLRPLVGRRLPGDPVAMIAPGGSGPAVGSLPADAQVCSCHAVTKQDICGAIGEHSLTDVASIKACTKAGTGCGSCVPLLKTLLVASGVAVSTALCEHFTQTRAQLFDIVRVTGIRTFTELVEHHGRGRGCDICKPVVASILASLDQRAHPRRRAGRAAGHQRPLPRQHPEERHLLGRPAHPRRRDHPGETDRHRPRSPRLRPVHQDHRRSADRPARRPRRAAARHLARLVDAGFESGHAYGKALRTVKSCVGSTWCRYGVQDSVSLAIELELRYRGLRSPHKIKFGRVRVRARVRRGAEQGRRRSSRPRTAGTSTSAATADSGRGMPTCCSPTSTPRRWSAPSTGSSCSTSAPPTACSAPRPGWNRWVAAWTTCAR